MRAMIVMFLLATAARAEIVTVPLVAVDTGRGDRQVPFLAVYDTQAAPGPVVVVGHAYLAEPERYASLADSLAAAGFVVAVPGSEATLLADQRVFAADLRFVLDEVRRLGTDVGSPLHGRPGTGAAVVGHSLGGAAALRAATRGGFDALVTLAVLNQDANPVDGLAAGVAVPTLMMAAPADCVTPPAMHELPVWRNLGAATRTGLDLLEGSHCGFAEPDTECVDAEGPCAAAPASMAAQLAATCALVTPWLREVLLEDAAAGARFVERVAADPRIQPRDGSVPAESVGWGGLRTRYR